MESENKDLTASPETPSETSYEIRILNPELTAFSHSGGGVLTMECEGERFPEVLLYRTYPLSKHEMFLSVRQPKGEEIGIVERLSDLDPDSQEAVRQELRLRYLVPSVTGIKSIKQYPGMWVWELETTLGPIKMSMRNLHEHIQTISANRLLISDIDGNRCEIFDIQALDTGSQKMLAKVI